jgi:lycopene cyclase domain-containing protein
MTYLLLNTVFLGVAALVTLIAVGKRLVSRSLARSVVLSLAVVLILTAVFDTVMIGSGLVAYDESNISGLMVGLAPIEDFAYPVAAALLLPALWVLLGRFGSRTSRPRRPADPADTTTPARTNGARS